MTRLIRMSAAEPTAKARRVRSRPSVGRPLTRTLLPLAVLLTLTARADAALAFESTGLDFNPSLGDETVVGRFSFTNTGDAPVTILSLKASCSCTATKLEKLMYAPGESGVITGVFTIGDRVGEQRKSITVSTDEAGAEPYRLLMRVQLPPQAQLIPRVLVWRIGDEPAAKIVDIVIPDGVDQAIDRATTTGRQAAAFTCSLETVGAGRYRVSVAPADTSAPRNAVIEVGAGAKAYRVHVRVSPPKAATGEAAEAAP
ncbi:MAG TPA: DUF1573 domain-containing protein [Planctomycetota bacterium]|nr:DUF1573 domain-containing protein [Planctomycetota bacterium]